MYEVISRARKAVLSSISGEGLGLAVSAANELASSHMKVPDYVSHSSQLSGTNASMSSVTITRTGRGVAL